MIIFGTYVLYKVLMEGTFQCPQCVGAVECQVRRGRRWFHIFWIPLIPIGHQPEHVRCKRCKSLWSLSVLGADGDQFRRIPRIDAGSPLPAGPAAPQAQSFAQAPPVPQAPAFAPTPTVPQAPPAASASPAPYLQTGTPVEDSADWAKRYGLSS